MDTRAGRASDGRAKAILMCGITGYLGTPGSLPPPAVLGRMTAALRHRGPDGSGTLSERGVGLGHTRLSIVDLSGGKQPLANEDGTVWTVFNGEIFNYVELRRELEARGHVFHTRSDTEVIVHAYEDEGTACVKRLNGDFAFAIWDRRQRRLMLARDRMGVRPLYYTVHDGALVFGSEVKSLLEFPGIEAKLDPIALEQCFTFWFPLPPRTPWAGIRELPPGHLLVAQDGHVTLEGLKIERYWKLEFPEASDTRCTEKDEARVAEELESLLIDATRLRVRADVPVGAYLSGGLDSSATAALVKLFPDPQLRTFSVNFDSDEYDEAPYQQRVIRALDTVHSSVHCTNRDIATEFPQVIRHTERPVIRTAAAPLFVLSRLVRESGFKVVMTGEGADEILGGYDIFKEAKVRRFWARQPKSAWRPLLLARLYPYLAGVQKQPQAYLQAFFGAGLDRVEDPLFSHLPRFTLGQRAKRLFSHELRSAVKGYDAVDELRQALPEEFMRWHPLSQAQYLESAYLLPGYILSSQGDRVAMAHAVEGRFPFLDHRVVEFASRIPPGMKLKGLREKHILRRAIGRHVPPEILARAKQPYRAPESECFSGTEAPEYAREMLSQEAVANAGCFDADAVKKLVAKCRSGSPVGMSDNMALVGILSTQLLHHHFARAAANGSPRPLD
jgi:asparagine synthase (glutamine-hydrolysing)